MCVGGGKLFFDEGFTGKVSLQGEGRGGPVSPYLLLQSLTRNLSGSSLHVEFKLSELISITIDEFTASPRYNSLDKEGRSGTSQQHLLKASL